MQANKSVDTNRNKSRESNTWKERKFRFHRKIIRTTENEIFSSMSINCSIWRVLRVRHPLCRIHRTSIVLHSAIAEDVLQFLIYIVTFFFRSFAIRRGLKDFKWKITVAQFFDLQFSLSLISRAATAALTNQNDILIGGLIDDYGCYMAKCEGGCRVIFRWKIIDQYFMCDWMGEWTMMRFIQIQL